jgi:hypothetical protein
MKMFWKLTMILGLASALLAQSPKPAPDSAAKKEAAEQEVKPVTLDNFYKLSFVIYETEDGKRLNQRDYSMIGKANASPPISLKVGTRVPVYSEGFGGMDKATQYQYIDAGLDIRCSLREPPQSKLQANCDFNISSFVLPEQAADGRSVGKAPVMRSTYTSSWAVLTPGKPSVISTIDDVNSKKRMQIEVTATKID